MARQSLGLKKVAKLMQSTGLPLVGVLVRGGTDHRKDLLINDGSVVHLYRDGSMVKSEIRHGRVSNVN